MESKKEKAIFLGSSTEAVEVMNEVAAVIGEKFKTLKWNSPNAEIFVPGQSTIDNLIKTIDSVAGAVFVFNADDKTWFKDNMESRTVRDNVLFEYGLFMGKLGKGRVVIVSKNNPHIPSDLNGITYIDVNGDESVWGQAIRTWLKNMDDQ